MANRVSSPSALHSKAKAERREALEARALGKRATAGRGVGMPQRYSHIDVCQYDLNQYLPVEATEPTSLPADRARPGHTRTGSQRP